jgi:hypothetical protein
MTMPETAVHEDDGVMSLENHVGPPRKLPGIQPEPEARPMEQAPGLHLWARILASDGSHDVAACRGINFVRHLGII